MLRIRWSEKAKRLVKQYSLKEKEVEAELQKKERREDNKWTYIVENGGIRIIFTIDEDNMIQADVRLR